MSPEAPRRHGVTLTWPEAFVIVPEIATEELDKVFAELAGVKAELEIALRESRYATNRAKNADLRLIEVLRHLGIGDNATAEHLVKMARQSLGGGPPAE